jgi:hypothetical protein
MKMQITVRTFTGGVSIVAQSDRVGCADEELHEYKSFVKGIIENGHYLSIGGTIIPGEFLRNHCVVDIITEE